MRIVVTAGHNKSLYAIALMHQLQQAGHEVVACIQVKTFQLKRLRVYLRQYGFKTVKAKFQSHVLRQANTYLANETKPIKDYMQQLGIKHNSVSAFCKANQVKMLRVNALSEEAAADLVQQKKADLIIYAGGGILRKEFIKSSLHGVLNAHSAYLPFFRGMNVIEWSALYGFRPYTTVHFIDVGIDTGKILHKEPLPYNTDLYTMRGNAIVHNVELLCKVIKDFPEYLATAQAQTKKEGKQFFVMHDRLKEVVIKSLAQKDKSSFVQDLNNRNELHFD